MPGPDGSADSARDGLDVTLSIEAKALLDGRNVAHLATILPDGAPKVDPVWVGRDTWGVLVATHVKSIKAANLTRDPRMALSITDAADPYRQLLIRGELKQIRQDRQLVELDALAMKYIGRPFPRRDSRGRVVLVLRPTLVRYYQSPLSEWRPRPP